MDPTLFRIDREVLTDLLVTIVVPWFFIERALKLIFERCLLVKGFPVTRIEGTNCVPCVLLAPANVVADALGQMLKRHKMAIALRAVAGGAIAGGRKASRNLLRYVMEMDGTATKTVRL